MKNSLITTTVVAILSTSSATTADTRRSSSDWGVSVGLATITVPSYLGDNKNRSLIAPDLSVSYKGRFFLSTLDGLGYNLVNKDDWRAGPIVKYHGGRRQDGDQRYFVDDDNTTDLQGLGDIDGTAELGGFVEFTNEFLNASLEVRQATDGHEGAIGDVFVQYFGNRLVGDKSVFYGIGPKISVGNSDYLNAFFGVNEAQAIGSGLSTYEVNSGLLSYGIHGSLVVSITDRVSLIGFGSVDVLADDVADSPLVATRGSDEQGSAGILLNVSFD